MQGQPEHGQPKHGQPKRVARPRSATARLGAAILPLIFLWLAAAPALACTGDCNADGRVAVNELIAGVNLSLGAGASACGPMDGNGDDAVSIAELIAAVGFALNGCPAQTRAFVVTSNFMAGSFATVDLDEPRAVSRSTAQRRVHRDAVVRTRGELVYVVNRRFGDNIQILDPADAFKTVLQCSVGNGTNPHDIAFAADDKAYVSLFEEPELLIVDPSVRAGCGDFVRGRVDLGAVADADGVPDMDQMTVVDGRLYVALQRLDINSILRQPAGKGAIAVVDIASDALVDTIELSGENPFAATKGLTVRDGKLYVAQAGVFNVMDGGIERVDLASGQAEGFFVTEAQLGGDVTDFVLVSQRLAYALVSRPGFSAALVAFDPTTAALTATLLEVDGYTLFDLELNDRGELWLADRHRQRNGVRVYRAADGAPLVEQPLDLGLAPFEIVFIR